MAAAERPASGVEDAAARVLIQRALRQADRPRAGRTANEVVTRRESLRLRYADTA